MALCMLEGAGNRTYDLTHNHNDGVLTNGPIWKPGRNGAAISFDGVDDYVRLHSNYVFTVNHSIGMWIKPSTVLEKRALFGDINTSYYGYLKFVFNSGATRFVGETNTNSDFIRFEHPDYPFSLDSWYHIIVTEDNNKIWTMYIDGGSWSSTSSVGATLNPNLTINTIGYGYSGAYWGGIIDDVRIWNRALSPQEVQDLYINPYGFIYQPQKYWLMPQGVTIPPHLLFRRVA